MYSRTLRLWQSVETYRPPLTRVETLAATPCLTGIEFICGLPGGGKSMLGTQRAIDELRKGHRPIVTNLALRPGRCQEYLHSLGCNVHLVDRLRVLDRGEVPQFYLHRSPELSLRPVGEGQEVDFGPSVHDEIAAGGVFYLIDEAHKFFPIESRIEGNSPIFMYLSQHRKVKDVVIFITQSPENVHSKIRRLGHDWHYVRYLATEKFHGFRKGDNFQVTTYRTMRTDKNPGLTSDAVKNFRLDADGLASCYDTAAGVGFVGAAGADGGARVKGFHMRWVWVLGALAVFAVVALLLIVPRLVIHRMVGGTLGSGHHSPAGVVTGSPARPAERTAVRPAEDAGVLDIRSWMSLPGGGLRVLDPETGRWVLVVRRAGPAVLLEDGRYGRLR